MTTTQPVSTWAPLQSPVFRALWIAQFVSNLGTWMQTVGAQWMLVDDPRAAVLVPLVQTATPMLPGIAGSVSAVGRNLPPEGDTSVHQSEYLSLSPTTDEKYRS